MSCGLVYQLVLGFKIEVIINTANLVTVVQHCLNIHCKKFIRLVFIAIPGLKLHFKIRLDLFPDFLKGSGSRNETFMIIEAQLVYLLERWHPSCVNCELTTFLFQTRHQLQHDFFVTQKKLVSFQSLRPIRLNRLVCVTITPPIFNDFI